MAKSTRDRQDNNRVLQKLQSLRASIERTGTPVLLLTKAEFDMLVAFRDMVDSNIAIRKAKYAD